LIPEAISEFYSSMLGERWQRLYPALLAPEARVGRWNQFSKEIPPQESFFTAVPTSEIPRDAEGLLRYYVMDLASFYAAQALQVESGERVLDMCAAPGGKSLILAEALASSGELIANELSQNRRERLKKVIQQYIPRSVRDRVWVTGKDAGQFALTHKESFDRILLDAPCSGERHLFASPQDLQEWKPSRSDKLAQRQYALLTAALLACRPGGKIVYSTCSISTLENDDVIERLQKKKKNQFEIRESPSPMEGSEATKYGRQIWPDATGFGPIYYAVLQKI